MKKLFTLLAACATVSSAFAADVVNNVPFRSFEVTAPTSNVDRIPSRAGLDVEDAITVAPEGKVTQLTRSGKAYYNYYGYLYDTEYTGLAGELVECDNGDVYLKNPVAMLNTGLYIKGQKKDNTLVFELPQVGYLESHYGVPYPYKFTTLQYCESEDTYYPVGSKQAADHGLETVPNTFVIEILEDGSYRYDAPNNADIMAGLADIESDRWVGYGEVWSLWTVFDTPLVEAPAGADAEEVAVLSNGDGYYGSIYLDNDDIYVKGLFSKMPNSWIKGKVEGDKVVFASGQYLGTDRENNAHTYFVGATLDEETNRLIYADNLTFDYDKEAKKLSITNNQAAVMSGSADKVAYIQYLLNPEISWIPAKMSYNPAAPVLVDYDFNEKYKELCVKFDVPTVNEEGILLDKNYIYYSFYVDNELYVFTTDVYNRFKEDMSLFSYSFTDGRDIMFLDGVHEAWFYFSQPKNIGIRSFYIKDGVVLGESALTLTSGIADTVSDNAAVVKSTEYYDLSGRKVTTPANGLFIKVTNFADGTITTEKQAVK